MWAKSWVEWAEDDTAYLSVPFTWLLSRVAMRAVALSQEYAHVRAGGPAVSLCPDRLPGLVEIGGEVDALTRHNPDATVTSRGCIRQCPFCAVHRVEGELRELDTWEPKPIVCDNNLLACSRRHFDRVIDSLKGLRDVDFNQGLDARLLTDHHAGRLAELHLKLARISWDDVREETAVMEALFRLLRAGIGARRIRAYVLIGYEDTPEDAYYRLDTLQRWGIRANVQRYQPLTAARKNEFVGQYWTRYELARFTRYWNRQAWLGGVKFEDYR